MNGPHQRGEVLNGRNLHLGGTQSGIEICEIARGLSLQIPDQIVAIPSEEVRPKEKGQRFAGEEHALDVLEDREQFVVSTEEVILAPVPCASGRSVVHFEFDVELLPLSFRQLEFVQGEPDERPIDGLRFLQSDLDRQAPLFQSRFDEPVEFVEGIRFRRGVARETQVFGVTLQTVTKAQAGPSHEREFAPVGGLIKGLQNEDLEVLPCDVRRIKRPFRAGPINQRRELLHKPRAPLQGEGVVWS